MTTRRRAPNTGLIHRLIPPLLLAAGVLAACQAGGGPSPSRPAATPPPTPVAEWARFASDRYGYAVDHPADWRALEKAGAPSITILRPYNSGADVITSEESHRYLARDGLQVAAAELEADMDLAAFTNSVHMPCGGPHAEEELTLSGEPALSRKFSCNGNRPFYVQVTALHDGRGYVLWFMSSQKPKADERPAFATMLESFEFTDAAAAAADDD